MANREVANSEKSRHELHELHEFAPNRFVKFVQ